MEVETGNYYIFFNNEDYLRILTRYINDGYGWIFGGNTILPLKKEDFPVVLNCSSDDMTLMYGIVEQNKKQYFSDERFVKLYNEELDKIRIKKLKRILDEDETRKKL